MDQFRFASHNNCNRGAVLAELALSLPIFLLLVYIIIFVGVMLNAKASLGNAMGTGLRLAATRGNDFAIGQEILPILSEWHRTGSLSNPELDLLYQVLFANVSHGSPPEYLNRYKACLLGDTFPQASAQINNLNDLPAPYLYTLVYLNEALRKSIGNQVKMPCRADGAAPICDSGSWNYQISDDDGPGCVSCQLLNPDDPSGGGQYSGTEFPLSRMAVECAYEPDNLITRPIVGLFRLLGMDGFGLFTVKRRATFISGDLN